MWKCKASSSHSMSEHVFALRKEMKKLKRIKMVWYLNNCFLITELMSETRAGWELGYVR